MQEDMQEAISEVLYILDHTNTEDVNKIPNKFYDFLRNNSSKTYKPDFECKEDICQMELKPKTKAILGVIYREYWCNEEERNAFDKALSENEDKYQKELREKYNLDIFERRKKNDEVQKLENNNESAEMIAINEKTNIFKKIINWFKNIIKK